MLQSTSFGIFERTKHTRSHGGVQYRFAMYKVGTKPPIRKWKKRQKFGCDKSIMVYKLNFGMPTIA